MFLELRFIQRHSSSQQLGFASRKKQAASAISSNICNGRLPFDRSWMAPRYRCAQPRKLLTARFALLCASCVSATQALFSQLVCDLLHLRSFWALVDSATWWAMDREVQEVELAGLGAAWLQNPEVKDRLMEEGSRGLILPPEGEKAPLCIQSTAITNDMFLKPVMVQMRAARNLKIPSVEALAKEISVLWYRYFEAKEKRKAAAAGRPPKLPADFRLSDVIMATCHSDAKHIKSLLSMCKKQFVSERASRESQ